MAEAASEYDVEAWRAAFGRLLSEHPDAAMTKLARKHYDPASALEIGSHFPDFQLCGLDGRSLSLDDFHGKVLLVDFWATWCPPCVKDLPLFRELQDRYRDQGLAILSLSIDAKPEVVSAFLKTHAMPWTHAFLESGRRHPLAERLSVGTIPRAFLVGRDGRILETRRAALRGEKLVETLKQAF